jgi:hypothetical protein
VSIVFIQNPIAVLTSTLLGIDLFVHSAFVASVIERKPKITRFSTLIIFNSHVTPNGDLYENLKGK